MALDFVVVMAAIAVGVMVWVNQWGGESSDIRRYLVFGLVSLPMWSFVFRWQGMYRKRDDTRLISDIRRVSTAVALGAVGFVLLGWPVQLPVPRGIVAVVVVLLVPLLLIERQIIRSVVRRRRRAGIGIRPIAIMGTNAEAMDLAQVFDNPILGRDVIAFLTTGPAGASPMHGRPVVQTDHPARTASELGAETVVIATTALDAVAPASMLRSFLDFGVEVEMTSALTGISNDRVSVDAIGRFPLLTIDAGFRGGWRATAKRGFDITVSAMVLLLAVPILVVAAIAVKLDTPGPVLFSQDRLGRRGRTFRILKFRTMQQDAEKQLAELTEQNEASGPMFKMAEDPRVTRVGRFLRSSSIDELPQFWNVLRGEMSVVGPRPALPTEAEFWDDELRNRLRVCPGITGMWQVNGRSEAGFDEYQRLDMFYIDNWSMLTDIGIMLRTIPAVVARRGAV